MSDNEEFRIEHDFIGDKQVPKDAYYGVQTLRALKNFQITGYKIDRALIIGMCICKKASARANMEVGLLDPKIGNAICEAAQEIIDDPKYHKWFKVDPIQGGAGTSINMNTNEVIANRALEIIGEEKGRYDIISPNTHVNMAQSTNDAFPTGLHIAAMIRLDMLEATLDLLIKKFKKKADGFGDAIKMGRTHLQDAVPVRFSQEFNAYAAVLERDLDRIKQCRHNLLGVNMGATATGTGLNADPEYIKLVEKYLQKYSHKPIVIHKNLVDATQNTDAYTQTSAALKICMLNLSKIANDLRLMASGPRCGLNEINLPPRQPGSSIMPGKVNPVMLEVVNQTAFQVCGNDLTISMASEAGQFELNVMEPVLAFNLLQSINIMTNVMRAFRKYCLDGITINVDRGREYVERSVGIITAINPHVGYETAAAIAKEAIETGKPVREIILDKKILTKEEIDIILDPKNMTTPGISGEELLKNRHSKDGNFDIEAQKADMGKVQEDVNEVTLAEQLYNIEKLAGGEII